MGRQCVQFQHFPAEGFDILTSLEEHLGKVWGLKIKESSRACMVCKGNPDRPLDPDLWPLCTSTTVLGHIVQNEGELGKIGTLLKEQCGFASGKTAEVRHAHVLIRTEKLDFFRQLLFPISFGKSADGLFKRVLLLNLTTFNAE